MSDHAYEPEQKSSVKLVRNAKGDAQIEVKLYDGVVEDEITRLKTLAVNTYRELETEFYGAAA